MNNPYYLKDTQGNYYNEYPEFQVWEDGRRAGIKEVVEFLRDNCYVQNTKATNLWQSKLKEWGI